MAMNSAAHTRYFLGRRRSGSAFVAWTLCCLELNRVDWLGIRQFCNAQRDWEEQGNEAEAEHTIGIGTSDVRHLCYV